jgi:Protein of unknown function (DUF3305)
MSSVAPQLRIPVGVVVERREVASPWAEVIWRTVAVLGGVPDTAAWTPLAIARKTVTFYAGAAAIELYRSEADNYRRNLASAMPAIWVALHETGGDPPYTVASVTADPAEGEGLTEAAQGIIEAVAMPEPLRHTIAAFVAEHHVEQVFERRKRERADPEALARHDPRSRRRR